VVVNDTFVRRFSPDTDAVDRRLHLGGPTVPAIDIIGVVGTIQQRATFVNGQPVAALPGVFVASAQYAAQYSDAFVLAHTWFQPSWIVRTQGPVAIIPSLQRALREVDSTLTFNKFRTIDDVESETMTTPRTLAWLLAMLAAIALSLCIVGIYGLVANNVAERRRELGVRIALGATPLDTITTAVAGSIWLVLCGALAGLALSLPATAVMRQVVFGVSVNDPLTLTGAAFIVVLTALAAVILPASRTLRMNVTAVLNSW
jgi:hypothetical protein